MDSVEETLSLAAKTRNILTLFTPGQRAQDLRRKILLFLQEKDELISSFCAMLSYCLRKKKTSLRLDKYSSLTTST